MSRKSHVTQLSTSLLVLAIGACLAVAGCGGGGSSSTAGLGGSGQSPSDRSASSPASVPVLGAAGPSTKGCGTAHPSYIYGGGDASDQIMDIRWTSWGSRMATGTGKALWVVTTVAAGRLEPVRVVAFNLERINDHYEYRSLDFYFPQHGQKFNPSAPSFAC